MPGVTYIGNVGKSCSAQDKAVNPSSSSSSQTAPMGWVNPAAFNFDLTSGSPAINAGSAQYAPATDRGAVAHRRTGRRRIRVLGRCADRPGARTGPVTRTLRLR